MFERFTDDARQVVVIAQDEARDLKHNYLGTEHILLGLLRDEDGAPARVLASFGVSAAGVRKQVGRIVGEGDEVKTGQIPFTPRAKKVLELSLREALGLGHDHLGPEHILLGLTREDEGVAAQILLDFEADAETIRSEVLRVLEGAVPQAPGWRVAYAGHGRLAPRRPIIVRPPARVVARMTAGWIVLGIGLGVLAGRLIWG